MRLYLSLVFFVLILFKGKTQSLIISNSVLIGQNSSGFLGPLDLGDQFGNTIEVIGDIDKDGIEDMAVGAPNDDDGGTNRGAVWILFMNSNGTVKSQEKISLQSGGLPGGIDIGDVFGTEIEALGDFDKDGVPDIAVYSRQDGVGEVDLGAIFILFLNTNGTVKSIKEISNTKGNWTPNLINVSNFGFSIENMGDMDGDGVIDLAVGTPYQDEGGITDCGAIYLVYLNADATVKNFKKISRTQGGDTGPISEGDVLGVSLANIGDLDKDGVTDLAAGIYADDGGTNRGAVVIFFLNANGTVKSHQRISSTSGNFTETLDDQDLFGHELLFVGDMDKDGYVELLVNAIWDDDGGVNRGAVYNLSLNENGTVYKSYKISSTSGHNNKIQISDNDNFGAGMGIFSDLNNDTYPELVMGLSLSDLFGNNFGVVYILSLMDTCNSLSSAFIISDTIVCTSEISVLTNQSIGYSSVQWSVNDVPYSSAIDTQFNSSIPGLYKIELKTIYQECSVIFSKNIHVIDYPQAFAGVDTSVSFGQPVLLSGCCGDSYKWEPDTYLSDANGQNTMATPNTSISYTLTVTNAQRCISKDSLTIKVLYDLFIPQLFSPNDDGSNDNFKVYGKGLKSLEFSVYNSWGERVYHSSDKEDIMDNGWNGKYKGVDQPQGAYVWKIEGVFIDDSPAKVNGEKSGSVLLVR